MLTDEHYDGRGAVNPRTGQAVVIRELVPVIAELTRRTGSRAGH